MNRLSHNNREAVPSTAEPHTARRVIRYRAADNTKSAIARQFPGVFAVQVTAGQPAQQYMQGQQGSSDATQTA